ncbi:putative Ig domain-containing protein [Propionicimonas sp.]|uniref:RCC1 domain-containing protein n=1 Tax=Propionicimonas sp. TaxID=1955623 RepID=UPI001D3AC418|nr:putative Ig domain-containing protein [Propionicimonas sp.]MBU3976575.1 putative Ig domain-containing protein [Actinomycetota bacterium]MBU3986598.1 putative Ig domain-containing protein [Actinomycetota bacterium]MBU4007250.1 putative Ig domain-containing protein [Actinomycetota bacterium]MBU4065003.1 putative Ig domain-containing protein [Actinomycetota bacterium]MBU4094516.1 putative Ig domain-containing protein [Actinomycetota bacterium]
MRRLAALVTAGLLAIGLFAGAPALAEAKTKKPSLIKVAPAVPTRGVAFKLTGKMPTKVVRPVVAQYKSGSKWKTLASGKTNKTGAYSFTVKTSASKLSVRVVAKKVKIKKKKYAKVTTKTKTFNTVAPPTPPPAPAITSKALPLTTVTLQYAVQMTASNGAAPLTWSATGLPAGLSIGATTGKITGAADSPGKYQVIVKVTDKLGRTASKSLDLRVGSRDRLIAAGWAHTCAINSSGALKCWGANSSAQLGDGTDIQRNTPTQVYGLTSQVVAVTAGNAHTCALTSDGLVYCWGANTQGQLGDGTLDYRLYPTRVSGLIYVTAIDAGAQNTCALSTLDTPFCWGDNSQGQIGDGTTEDRRTATWVHYLSGVKSLSAGGNHVCVVQNSGSVKCWGNNSKGELGNANLDDQALPVEVQGLSTGGATVSSGTSHTCVVTTGNAVNCWGSNSSGQLGDNSTTDRPTLVTAAGLSISGLAVSSAHAHTCAVTTVGSAKCWGDNSSGQLGTGYYTDRLTPAQVSGLTSGVTAITTGAGHSCARTAGNVVKCWGTGANGQLGNGANLDSPTAVEVNSLG